MENDNQYKSILKRLIIAWDTDNSLEFIASLRAGRKVLGFKLSDEKEDMEDLEVLRANGYKDE